jgi:hypothetical protein
MAMLIVTGPNIGSLMTLFQLKILYKVDCDYKRRVGTPNRMEETGRGLFTRKPISRQLAGGADKKNTRILNRGSQ